ncbi:hypothetical protein E2562_037834 [Oryza meyeriana var. granulata]|uniref:DRBM domain-containing protein n=1 Tax=Oryza meyeriana var. granulata TaxID=110450 RepID=A0A6G1DVJ7_9ORYZ|nr:hypothetical protein E2562_037834 [Oryza meyeriana var. granulata]
MLSNANTKGCGSGYLCSEMEGAPNKPFISFAGLRNEKFTSSSHHREPEQTDSVTEEYTCAEFTEALRSIDQEAISCKVILYDFSMRANITKPSYLTVKSDGICSNFISSVLVGGCEYTGDGATTWEEAKENAARVVIKSILATRNNYMLESIRSNKPTGTTAQVQQSSQTSIHPAVTFAPTNTGYIPCAPHYQLRASFVPHEQIQWRHPSNTHVPVLSHEQMQWRHPTAHLPFLPHQQMQWRHPPTPTPFLPHGQMQRHDPAVEMPFLPAEQIQWNAPIAYTPPEIMQMWQLPQSISSSNPVLQNGLYSNTVQDDDMIVEVGSYEEGMTLSGTKRKMDQSEEPKGKQARTSQ